MKNGKLATPEARPRKSPTGEQRRVQQRAADVLGMLTPTERRRLVDMAVRDLRRRGENGLGPKTSPEQLQKWSPWAGMHLVEHTHALYQRLIAFSTLEGDERIREHGVFEGLLYEAALQIGLIDELVRGALGTSPTGGAVAHE